MDQKFAVLSKGPNYLEGYNTVKQARDDGALVLAWGYVYIYTLKTPNFGMKASHKHPDYSSRLFSISSA